MISLFLQLLLEKYCFFSLLPRFLEPVVKKVDEDQGLRTAKKTKLQTELQYIETKEQDQAWKK